jgi:hypothetical protein
VSIIKQSEEITTIIYEDGRCEIWRRNDFNSPYTASGDYVLRWNNWIHILEMADRYPALGKAIEDVELMYNLVREDARK